MTTSRAFRARIYRYRRQWLLTRLSQADGPSYDELIRELIAAEVPPRMNETGIKIAAVHSVRSLLWNQIAVTESDETIWLTPLGWQHVARYTEKRSA